MKAGSRALVTDNWKGKVGREAVKMVPHPPELSSSEGCPAQHIGGQAALPFLGRSLLGLDTCPCQQVWFLVPLCTWEQFFCRHPCPHWQTRQDLESARQAMRLVGPRGSVDSCQAPMSTVLPYVAGQRSRVGGLDPWEGGLLGKTGRYPRGRGR